MNSAVEVKKGDAICRPTEWVDVVKFFLLNYGLHALTVISTPGSTTLPVISTALCAIGLPFSGIFRALVVIYAFAVGQPDPLQTALRAGALCTVVRLQGSENLQLNPISPRVTQVHGQHPVPVTNLHGFLAPILSLPSGGNGQNLPQSQYCLVRVPTNFTVNPIKNHPGYPPKPQLACNYSVLKTIAAIAQIIYSSFELYKARGHQIEKFGYAAYSLTVTPYILMSLTNLFATLCAPQYPSMFIVLYRGTKERPNSGEGNTSQQHKTEMSSIVTGESRQQDSLSVCSGAGGGQQNELESVISAIEQDQQQGPGSVHSMTGDDHDQKKESEVIIDVIEEAQQPDSWAAGKWQEEVEAMISGAVGEAYGEFPGIKDPPRLIRSLQSRVKDNLLCGLIGFIATCMIAAPYITIQLLTDFEDAQSTRSQRSWIMAWLVVGQCFGSQIFFLVLVKGTNKLTLHNTSNTTLNRYLHAFNRYLNAFNRYPNVFNRYLNAFNCLYVNPTISSSHLAALTRSAPFDPDTENVLRSSARRSTSLTDLYLTDPTLEPWVLLLRAMVMSIATMGGFVVVAKMMLEDEVCTVI